MRCKITALLLVFCFLVSCTPMEKEIDKEKAAEAASKPFSTGAVIKYKDIEARASILKEIEGSVRISFESPQSLKDISFFFYDGVVKVSYKDLSFNLDTNSLPGNAVASMIVSTLNATTEESGINVSLDGTSIVIKGIMEEGEFYLSLDAKNGNFLKLEIPASEFSMEFNNFKVLG